MTPAQIRRRVIALGVEGTAPAMIAAELGLACSTVRDVLMDARRRGVSVPKHKPGPLDPVMPSDCSPRFSVAEAERVDASIQQLAGEGVSQRAIARTLDVSFGYVQRRMRRARAACAISAMTAVAAERTAA